MLALDLIVKRQGQRQVRVPLFTTVGILTNRNALGKEKTLAKLAQQVTTAYTHAKRYRSFPRTVSTVVHDLPILQNGILIRNTFSSYSRCESVRKKISLIGKYKQKEIEREIGLDAASD